MPHSGLHRFIGGLGAASLAFGYAVPHAAAQSGVKNDSVGEDAVDAVTQPLSDLNLRSKDIPAILTRARITPYDLESLDDCVSLRKEIKALDDELGADADAPDDEAGLVNKGLQLGGNLLSGFIPFRGVIRQLSGANAEGARWRAAVYAGVARRSYLKGYAKGLACPTETQSTVKSAQEILGIE